MLTRLIFALSLVCASSTALAAERQVIDARVDAALSTFRTEINGGEGLLRAAKGVLVFPSVKKGALVVGGAYGEGALIEEGTTSGYYSTASASIGLQAGGQTTSRILLFMTEEALTRFKQADGWEVGVDADVALVDMGTGTKVSNRSLQRPVVAFVFGHKGLMAGIDLNGSKISPIDR